ncbi:HAD family hydrolase [Phaeocystidibacter luteus]|uniref:Haloacid dehalogenase-like hydrolase n=1 Tax=Phaeocystidibacter luteus TaxID=911197 RepID=A0A6N6RCV8_9FLAO|nr:HAD family hydrolase [Phaeocystidibacter luteus]KAB2805436.1 haloacid dehalogenase-like hydrolase [Phaeocystidibacter luteus]
MKRFLSLTALVALVVACSSKEQNAPEPTAEPVDALPSWNDTETKSTILEYVQAVTDEGSPSFIPVEDRLVTFDNDGTLWAEKPVYFQLYYALDRISYMAKDHPEWENEEPYASGINKDLHGIAAQGYAGLFELIGATQGGMTTDEYHSQVKAWLDTAVHPTTNRPYTEMVYQPMIELIHYLQDNDFNVYIFSAGGIDFMRVWATEVYGIPKEKVMGSSMKTQFSLEGGAHLEKLDQLDAVRDKEAKPEFIYLVTGGKPVIAGGNSDGDLAMLQYTATNTHPFLNLYVHHTDSVREWAYDRDGHVGRLDAGLDEAVARGWTLIDMKYDWKVIFPNE